MEVEITTTAPHRARITLDARELYLLQVALERACYLDTDPADQKAALTFAEDLLRAIRGQSEA
jgi:hypothetical protein